MSGRRSALLSAVLGEDNLEQLYRLKGISLRPKVNHHVFEDGTTRIWGGEKYRSVLFEKRMVERFNQVLREEGIHAVMEYCGRWKYPQLVNGYIPAASIWKVEGDTRLDEFRTALELHLEPHLKERKVEKILNAFYYQSGYLVGQLLQLMHRSGQSWSCDSSRSNAHPGNVVLYRTAEDKAALGLVDFDASCDSNDFSPAKLRRVQQKDLVDFVDWLYHPEPGSLPLIYQGLGKESWDDRRKSGFDSYYGHLYLFHQGMNTLEKALHDGYKSKKKGITAEVELGDIWEIIKEVREK